MIQDYLINLSYTKFISLYSTIYFQRSHQIIKKYLRKSEVVVQFSAFKKTKYVVFGINYVLEIIKKYKNELKGDYKIYAVSDGTLVNGDEIILEIIGDYSYLIQIENCINGILSRASSIATNCYKIKQITSVPIIYMGDRQDHYLLQSFDGLSAYNAGIRYFTTNSQVALIKNNDYYLIGSMPHALIAYNNGDLIKTCKLFLNEFPNVPLFALVDYHNNIIDESLKVLNFFHNKITGIRIDTPNNLIDKSMLKIYGNDKEYYGSCKELIYLLRKKLDTNNYSFVKIILSSNLNIKKIKNFEKHNVPIDYYGIGKSLLNINLNVSANIVMLNHKYEAKYGKKYKITSKLKQII